MDSSSPPPSAEAGASPSPAPSAPASGPAADGVVVLMRKRLSPSDLASSVLRGGRVVLPRSLVRFLPARLTSPRAPSRLLLFPPTRPQTAADVATLVDLGCRDASARAVDAAAVEQAVFPLFAADDAGREWEVSLKKWTARSAPPKPIFVLERTAPVLNALRAAPGTVLELAVARGALRVRVLRGAEAAAAAAATAAAVVATGCCDRAAGCAKGAGHAGFCSASERGAPAPAALSQRPRRISRKPGVPAPRPPAALAQPAPARATPAAALRLYKRIVARGGGAAAAASGPAARRALARLRVLSARAAQQREGSPAPPAPWAGAPPPQQWVGAPPPPPQQPQQWGAQAAAAHGAGGAWAAFRAQPQAVGGQ
jgi:hypothetical protein